MLAQLTEEFVKSRVLEWLGKHDYIISSVKTLAEHGVDIRAKKARSGLIYVIECKGEPKTNPDKYRYPVLVSALGEIIQRVTRKKYVKHAIALPFTYKELILRRIPWMACKRLSLEVLLVNQEGLVIRLNWQDLKKKQKEKTKLPSSS